MGGWKLGGSLVPWTVWRAVSAVVVWTARCWRLVLGRVLMVGITGSFGKTTTRELTGAILSHLGRGRTGRRRTNTPHDVARTLLSVLPWHRFLIQELGGFRPGVLRVSCALLRPRIGVLTHVSTDHFGAFHGADAVAEEKRTLVVALPPGGVAVLNADDSRVIAMREQAAARVLTYGHAITADVRCVAVSARWPEKLTLRVAHEGVEVAASTRLNGEHWGPAVLAALATGVAAGVPLADGAAAVAAVQPVPGRFSEHRTADGVTFVLDTWKASLGTVPPALQFLRQARAARKIFVFGTLSDYPGAASPKYRWIAREALAVTEYVFLTGPYRNSALRAAPEAMGDRLRAFDSPRELSAYLEGFLGSGDLVLVKGSVTTDHLERLWFARSGRVDCWRTDCGLMRHCGDCRHLPGG